MCVVCHQYSEWDRYFELHDGVLNCAQWILFLSLQLVLLIITPKNSYASCMQGQTESVGSQWIGIWTDIFICSNKSSRYRWVPIIIISQRKSPTNISKWNVQIEFMFYVTYVIIIIIDLHVSVKTFARVYSMFLVSNLQ